MKNLTFALNYRLLALVCMFTLAVRGSATTLYWVANFSSQWNNTSNWSFTSGGEGGAGIPGENDLAVFNSDGQGDCAITSNIALSGLHLIEGYSGIVGVRNAKTVLIGENELLVESGNFYGGSAYIEIQSALILSGGVFVSTDSSLVLQGSSSEGATLFRQSVPNLFFANNGTLIIDASKNMNAPQPVVFDATNLVLFNFAVVGNSESGAVTLTTNSRLTVEGDLYLNSGSINGGAIIVLGNIISQNRFLACTSDLYLSGTTTQFVQLTGNESALKGNITVDNLSGIQLHSSVTLSEPSQILHFSLGILYSSSTSPLEIGQGVVVTGAKDASHVKGPVAKSGSESFCFPIGDGLHLAPLSISQTTDLSSRYVAEYNPGINSSKATDETYQQPVTAVSDCEHWRLKQTAGKDSVMVTLFFNSNNGCLNIFEENMTVCYKFDKEWVSVGISAISGNKSNSAVTSEKMVRPNGILTVGKINPAASSATNPPTRPVVFPNPFTNSIQVSVLEQSVLTLYDALGREVYSQSAESGITTINTSELPSGMYTLHVWGTIENSSFPLIKINE